MRVHRTCDTGVATRVRVRQRSVVWASVVLAVVIGASAVAAAAAGTRHMAKPLRGSGPATSTRDTAQAPRRGGSLVMARVFQPATLDPLSGVSDDGTFQTEIQIFDQLTELLPGSSTVAPGLAESWQISPNHLTYTFTLRNARFSNGAPVTSSDVQFSLDALLKKTNPFSGLFSFVRNISAPSRSTVVLHLKQTSGGLLSLLSFPAASIVPKAYYLRVGPKRFANAPIGSGAFEVARYSKGQSIVLKRNPYYWRKGLPYLDQVTLEYVPNDNTRLLDLESGSADIASDIAFSQVAGLRHRSGVNLIVDRIAAIDPIFLNEKYAPLASKAVRQALNYATPTSSIQRVAFGGVAQVANSMFPPNKYWDPTVAPYPYDVNKAKALLAQAGFSHGFKLQFTYVTGDSTAKAVGQILQSAWGQIGVGLSFRAEDFATWETDQANQNYQAAMQPPIDTSSDVPTDDEVVSLFYECNSGLKGYFTSYCDATLNKLALEAVSSTNEAQRTRLFHKIQRIGLADPIWVALMFTPGVAATKSSVHGFSWVTTAWWRLDRVWKQ